MFPKKILGISLEFSGNLGVLQLLSFELNFHLNLEMLHKNLFLHGYLLLLHAHDSFFLALLSSHHGSQILYLIYAYLTYSTFLLENNF